MVMEEKVEPSSTRRTSVNFKKRGKWRSQTEFLLSCIGLSVGIGNVWRFPYLAYQNGGGAFLVAYFILLVLVGKPVFYMELAIGQFSGLGALRVWRCFPIAKGVGIAMTVMSVCVAIYYNVVMCYTLYYIGQSLRSEVPWKKCHAWWGADSNCYVRESNQTLCKNVRNLSTETTHSRDFRTSAEPINSSAWGTSTVIGHENEYNNTHEICRNATQIASEQFWEKYVLQLTPSINNIGQLKWDLTLSLLICWIIVCLGLMKGIRSSGKLWRAAAEQMLFSLTLGWGCLIMYASYNRFENNLHRDAVFVSSLDFLTSIMSGIVIFAVLGNMSMEMQIDISMVAKGGQGLAFVTYPEALARLWCPQLWSVLFFFMLFLLAIDSEFSYLENFFTVVCDEYPRLRSHKAALTSFFCLIFFILGLPCVTQGGQYVLNLMDRYGGGYAGLFVTTAEIIVIMWGYGVERFSADLEFMMGFKPSIYWRICWKYVSPIFLLVLLSYSYSMHTPIDYGGQPYPAWGEGLGWMLMLISVLQIPLWAVIEIIRHRKNLRKLIIPHPDWGPDDPDVLRSYRMKFSINKVEDAINAGGEINLGMDRVNDK